ncbi:MAG: YbhB/YbcL family Raf kinase inhibitor-like protein [Pseudomonadota bacterium]
MRLWSESFSDGGVIAPQCAFAVIDPATHVRLSGNRNPHLAWDEVPAGTASLILFCFDIDAPSVGTDVNQEGRAIASNLARTDFYHWTLADIAPSTKSIGEGALSDAVCARGKPGPHAALPHASNGAQAMRQGINDYTSWFAGDADMAGDYYGYDGPCPPWNDTRLHRYLFRIYALDQPRLELEGKFGGAQAMAAIRGHILDEAQIIGVYTLNPAVAATLGTE